MMKDRSLIHLNKELRYHHSFHKNIVEVVREIVMFFVEAIYCKVTFTSEYITAKNGHV